jgi:hypothetical protein
MPFLVVSKNGIFEKGHLVRVEFPQNAHEDRITGREMTVEGYEPPLVVVRDEGGTWKVHPDALVHVKVSAKSRERAAAPRSVTAEDVLGVKRRSRRKKR